MARRGAGDILAAGVAALPNAASRPGQVAMAEAVAEAFAGGEHLLVQAGTGTGKSLAYLAGVLAEDRHAVVSTATLALQSQLVATDIPRLLDAVEPLLGRRPAAALLKGRANYLCLLQLNQPARAGGQGTLDDERQPATRMEAQFADLRAWAESTTTGDRDELDWTPSPAVWRAVSVSASDCVGARRCPYGDQCFAEAARERARQADVVVTNHSLLALDVLTDGQVLPEHDVVVVDEAHELADRLTDQAADQLTNRRVRQAFARLDPAAPGAMHERSDAAAAGFREAIAAAPIGRLAVLPEALAGALVLLGSTAGDLASSIPGDTKGVPAEEVARRQQSRTRLLDLAEATRRVTEGRDGDVRWVEASESSEPVLKVAPLDVSDRLANGLLARHPVVATSATLTVGGRFAHLARAFGLPADLETTNIPQPDVPTIAPDGNNPRDRLRWRSLDVGSPFDYGQQARLFVAMGVPDPGTAGWFDRVLEELAELIRAAGGRTLGLFTSRGAALAAADAMRERLDVPVLLQGEAPLPSLVRRFRTDAATCLFGTLSLWQGVDAPGPACTLVVIDRIPFHRPDEPLPQARMEAADKRGESGFEEVSLARAAVLLAQGAGRLIRASGDRGLVAVLDPRLRNRRYGGTLRTSMPPFAYPTSRTDALNWLRRLDQYAPALLPVPPEPELARQLLDLEDEVAPTRAGRPRSAEAASSRHPTWDSDGGWIAGAWWGADDGRLLKAGVEAGRSVEQLARRHGVTVEQLRAALRELGLNDKTD